MRLSWKLTKAQPAGKGKLLQGVAQWQQRSSLQSVSA